MNVAVKCSFCVSIICVLFSIAAAHAQSYTVVDIGTLGGTFSSAERINRSGQVIGRSYTVAGALHSFLWDRGVLIDLGTLGGPSTVANNINDSGLIVGYSHDAATNKHAFSYRNGILNNLGTLGGTNSQAYGVNNLGQIVGYSYVAGDGVNNHAFIYTNGVMVDLGTMSGRESEPRDINDSGLIIATVTYAAGNQHAVLYSNNVVIDLGTLGGTNSYAKRINASGQVIGNSDSVVPKQTFRAFLYSGGTMTDLGALDATLSATDINSTGQIVGSVSSGGVGRAVLYTNGVLLDLNTVIPANSGWVLQDANGINDSGQIVGQGLLGGQAHSFLLNPISFIVSPQIITQPTGQSYALGGAVTLSVAASGGGLNYRWQFNGTNIIGATGANLALPNLTATNAGAYDVVVSNAAGTNISQTAYLDFFGNLKTYAGTILAGAAGRQYRVDYADVVNVGTTNWLVLTNITLPYSPYLLIDPNSPGKTQRYYRAVPVP